jgi:hypothetical protein
MLLFSRSDASLQETAYQCRDGVVLVISPSLLLLFIRLNYWPQVGVENIVFGGVEWPPLF